MAKDVFFGQFILAITLTSCMRVISGNSSFTNSMPPLIQKHALQQHKPESKDKRSINDQNDNYLELSQLYKTLQSEAQRRAICLQILDKKVVVRGSRVSTVDTIFGTDFSKNLPDKYELARKSKVFFSPQPQAGDPSESVPNVGWYLAVEYDWKGQVKDFYLSNIYK